MLRLAAAALALAVMASSAMSQTGESGQVPRGNSGAGIPGQPGNKNGPPAGSPSATKGQQDPAKVPGLPGNKSGPAAKPPSDTTER
jgi:hypothetical protein